MESNEVSVSLEDGPRLLVSFQVSHSDIEFLEIPKIADLPARDLDLKGGPNAINVLRVALCSPHIVIDKLEVLLDLRLFPRVSHLLLLLDLHIILLHVAVRSLLSHVATLQGQVRVLQLQEVGSLQQQLTLNIFRDLEEFEDVPGVVELVLGDLLQELVAVLHPVQEESLIEVNHSRVIRQ